MEQDNGAKRAGSTTIGHTVVIRGKLKSDEDLIVHGRIDAEITSAKSVLIEEAGIVKAGVAADSVAVSGILIGNAQAGSRMDILSPKIVISDGAAFRGQIDMQTFDAPRVTTPDDQPSHGETNGTPRLSSLPRPANGSARPSYQPQTPSSSLLAHAVTSAVAKSEQPAPAPWTPATDPLAPIVPASPGSETVETAGAKARDAAGAAPSQEVNRFAGVGLGGRPMQPPITNNQEPKPADAHDADDEEEFSLLGLGRKGRKKKGPF